MKPFLSSVFMFLTWIFATSAKICTIDFSNRAHAQSLLKNQYVILLLDKKTLHLLFYRSSISLNASALSIFRANSFGLWVVTHSLENFDFHDHFQTVCMNQHLLRYLDERSIQHFILTRGWSHFTISAYQKWSTKVSIDSNGWCLITYIQSFSPI